MACSLGGWGCTINNRPANGNSGAPSQAGGAFSIQNTQSSKTLAMSPRHSPLNSARRRSARLSPLAAISSRTPDIGPRPGHRRRGARGARGRRGRAARCRGRGQAGCVRRSSRAVPFAGPPGASAGALRAVQSFTRSQAAALRLRVIEQAGAEARPGRGYGSVGPTSAPRISM